MNVRELGNMLLHRSREAPADDCLMVTAFHSVSSGGIGFPVRIFAAKGFQTTT
jgi:hypothetical protein